LEPVVVVKVWSYVAIRVPGVYAGLSGETEPPGARVTACAAAGTATRHRVTRKRRMFEALRQCVVW